MIRTLILLSILAWPVAGRAQGKLDQVREAVDRPAADDTDKNKEDDSAGCADSSGSSGTTELFTGGRFTRYPYASPVGAFMYPLDYPSGQGVSARASAEVGSDFDGLTRTGLRLFLDTDTRLGIKTDWDHYSERLSCGCRDTLWLGDVTGTYRLMESEAVQMHVGVGVRFLLDHGRDRTGYNLLLGFDAFPARPWHLFGSVEGGQLGGADVIRVRGGAGVTWRWAEGFAGYDFVRIGGVNLQGPFVGVRVWY